MCYGIARSLKSQKPVESGAIMLYRGSEFRRYSVSPKWARGEGWNSEGVDAQSLKSHEIVLNFANQSINPREKV